MSHWSKKSPDTGNSYYERVRDATDGTGWSVVVGDSEEGPFNVHHEDGSEIVVVDSRDRTGTLRLTYDAAESANEAFKDDVTDNSLGNIFEFVIHILERHEKLN